MIGIYVHIPFCRKACHYCDFHFSTKTDYIDDMVNAIVREIEIRKDYLDDKQVRSVYFGGGTPSVLSAAQLEAIMQQIQQYFEIQKDAEITLEANPDDLSRDYLAALKEVGINRLSIGIQSFHQDELEYMNRSHTAAQAVQCLVDAKNAGFENITIDLIYGVPDTSEKKWQHNLEMVGETGVHHVSCYSLTIEPKTVFAHWVKQGKMEPSPNTTYDNQYNAACTYLKEAGFTHYEVSNFAHQGYEAVHNSAYWAGQHYIGFGPGAHSYNGEQRQWNVANNRVYMADLKENKVPATAENLSVNDRFNEMIMTRLRTANGIDHLEMDEWKDSIPYEQIAREMQALEKEGNIQIEENRIFIPEPKLYISDAIIARLFL